ncbi:TIGR02678 family protein [Saccharothrix sp. AJ9571]|nr:TIGR02678 family protein [Saccharothrix sp. AJ9571]
MILEETTREELRQATRFLVLNPLLHPGGRHAKMATLVHSHAKPLKAWFDEYLGWPLVIERDVIRLVKVPEPQTVTHRDDAPNARCCALFCLVLATLEDAGTQTVITELADEVTTIIAATEGIPAYDSTEYSERKAFIQAIRLLTTHGALVPVQDSASTHEDENRYVESEGNALYDVDHRTAALLLACPTPPARAAIYQHITRQSYPDTVEGANRRRRHAVMRRLVDHPVMYFDELTDDQIDYFRNQRALFVRQLREMLDTRLEVRAEGAAIIDDELTDLAFPKDTKDQFAALLFAHALADEPNATEPGNQVADEVLHRIADQVAPQLAARAIRASSPREVRQAALTVLTKLRLVEPLDEGGARTLPALGRYRNVREPITAQQEPAAALFALPGDEETDVTQS